MADAYGNVIRAPGSSSKARVNDDELLFSYSPPPFIQGGTLKTGQGVVPLGCPLERDSATGLYVISGSDTRLIGSATIVASTGVFTTTPDHGLSIGDQVVLGAITSTTGVTAATNYFVKTVPSSKTFTLSATSGGSALSLTTDGSTASVTETDASNAPTGIKGFNRTGVDSGVTGDIPKLVDIVMSGQLKYDRIKAANGAVDLTAGQILALNGRIDADLQVFIF